MQFALLLRANGDPSPASEFQRSALPHHGVQEQHPKASGFSRMNFRSNILGYPVVNLWQECRDIRYFQLLPLRVSFQSSR